MEATADFPVPASLLPLRIPFRFEEGRSPSVPKIVLRKSNLQIGKNT